MENIELEEKVDLDTLVLPSKPGKFAEIEIKQEPIEKEKQHAAFESDHDVGKEFKLKVEENILKMCQELDKEKSENSSLDFSLRRSLKIRKFVEKIAAEHVSVDHQMTSEIISLKAKIVEVTEEHKNTMSLNAKTMNSIVKMHEKAQEALEHKSNELINTKQELKTVKATNQELLQKIQDLDMNKNIFANNEKTKGVTRNCRLLDHESVKDYNEKRDLFDQENLHKEVEFQNQIEQSSINEDEQCAERKKPLNCTNLSPSKTNESIEIPTTSSNTVHDLGINPSSRHNCGTCGKSFASGRNLRMHITNVHEGKKYFSCRDCKKSFSQEGALNKHIESVHEKKRNFLCPHCKKNLSAKDSLAKHISIVHEKKKPFGCSICNKNFGTKLNLKRHIITHHKACAAHNGFIILKSLN
jgi:hypothetical protein